MSNSENGAAVREATPAFLRQFARRRSPDQQEERCELCSAALSPVHQHLLDPATRQISCSCDGCVILFCGQEGAHFLRIPRRVGRLVDFRMMDLEWESLMMPINLAFFYRDTRASRVVAMYPSPAGATESLLSLDSWQEIVKQNKPLQSMAPDVEALLVHRAAFSASYGAGRPSAEYYVVPIDECYRLVGLIRVHWHGLSGGPEVWMAIDKFFDNLRSASVEVSEAPHA